ncbi:uncharacterized protein LOC122509580 [Leptopilina heterotoma]|uniref:uncharacterized protein LOC122509580 n=1 Tax=Leptopilina heterotoma TaxID=63436 RepID=UPI001CA87D02|nr:uncharacterized protein LOC122509580 [Leptopilina heterotoma]
MSTSFYPNECIVCKKTEKLKRCSRCQMISYCGEVHQKSHWNEHKNICKIISNIAKEKEITHLYEDLRDCTLMTWSDSRKAMIAEVSSKLGRELRKAEVEMLQYPRSCYVCYDTKQENLTNCTKCPLVSFCQKHLDTTLHDKTCADIMTCHALDNENFSFEDAMIAKFKSLSKPSVEKLPTCTMEYLEEILGGKLNYTQKLYASLHVYHPLTIFGVLQKLNLVTLSKMTIYINIHDNWLNMRQFIENLFHLLPKLKELNVQTNCVKQMLIPGQLNVCSTCNKNRKKLSFAYYDDTLFNGSIDLAFFADMTPPDNSGWEYSTFGTLRHICTRYACPVVLTSNTEIEMKRVRTYFKSVLHNQTILHDGFNDFSSLHLARHWEDWRISQKSHYMIVAKSTNMYNSLEDIINSPETGSLKSKTQPDQRKIVERFYPGICQVCKCANAKEACTRCKMVFYCGQSHLKQDQSEHKDICKVILGLLNEKGTPHLFDNMDVSDEKSWLEAKVNFLKIARSKLNRDLMNYEKQIFLFPRTCFVCHESNLSVLKTCKCGVSLCKIHRDDTDHKLLCDYFNFNLKWARSKEKRQDQIVVTAFANKRDYKVMPTMDQYIDRYFEFKNYRLKPLLQNPRKVVISDFLTRSLTFIYIAEKLETPIPNTLYIHVVGALNEEFESVCYWHTVIKWFDNVTTLYIDFIGVELTENDDFNPKSTFHFHDKRLKNSQFTFSTYHGRYEDFFRNVEFRRPDVIIGYNLNLHESDLGLSACTWRETLSIISKMNVPFFLTAVTEVRARKDHEMIGKILGRKINYEFFGKNPYASFMPERDYETERLCYSNNYVVAYNHLRGPEIKKKVNGSKNQEVGVKNKNSFPKKGVEMEISNVEKKNSPNVKKKSEAEDSALHEVKKIAKGEFSRVKVNKVVEKVEKAEKLVENVEKVEKVKKLVENVEKVEKVKKLVEKVEKVEKPVEKVGKVENSNSKTKIFQVREELVNQNLHLEEENEILKENVRLMEENESLKNKISELHLK